VKTHAIKIDKFPFSLLLSGEKTFEMRFNDRDYQVGDGLILRETRWDALEMERDKPLVYTGREIRAKVTHMLTGPIYGLKEGWVCLSLSVRRD